MRNLTLEYRGEKEERNRRGEKINNGKENKKSGKKREEEKDMGKVGFLRT